MEIIAGGAFVDDRTIKTITIGGSVRTIDEQAFKWCTELERAEISAEVGYIGREAFAFCGKLHAYLDRGRRLMAERCFTEGQKITFRDGGRDFTVMLLGDIRANSPEHALMGFAAEPSQSRFMQLHYPEYLIPAAACYASEGGAYTEYLKANAVTAVCYSVDLGDSELTRRILDLGYLTERQAAECAAYAIEQKAFEQQLLIMRSKQDNFGGTDDKKLDDKFDW